MSIFSGAIKGAAAVAVPALLEGWKADIMAAREEALNKVRKQERKQEQKTEREFRTSERVAGEEAKAGEGVASRKAKSIESELDRKSREKVAGIRSAKSGVANTGKKIIPGQGIYDWDTEKLEPFPEKAADRQERALKMALVDVKAYDNEDDEGNRIESTQEMTARYYKDMTPKKEKKGGKIEKDSEVSFDHPTLGKVTHEDIRHTMKLHNMTYQQVIDKLGL